MSHEKINIEKLWDNVFTDEIKFKISESVVLGYAITDQIFKDNDLFQHPLSQNSRPHVRRDIVDILLEGLQITYPDKISCETKANIRKNFHFLEVMLPPFLMTQHHVLKLGDNPRYTYFTQRHIVNSKQLSLGFPENKSPYIKHDDYVYTQLTHGGLIVSDDPNEPPKPEFLLLGVPHKDNKGWWHKDESLAIVESKKTKEEIQDLAVPIINKLKKQATENDDD